MQEDYYTQLQDQSTKMFVIVAGNIGCGKTTLTSNLSERLGWKPMFESVEDNPYLSDFYGDMSRWSFALQIHFLTHRFNTHRQIEDANFSAIQDRSIYEDANIFARSLYEQGNMSRRDYDNYIGLYKTMIEYIEPPSLMIFLKRSVPKLMERIKQRGRDYEQSIPVDYISRLNDFYEEWYDSYDAGKCLFVDTDELDFLHNGAHFDKLVEKIHHSIDQQDLFFHYQ